MNANTENIYNDFFSRKLNEVHPSKALLDINFRVFLKERKSRRKKWVFFLIFLFILMLTPIYFLIIRTSNNKGNRKFYSTSSLKKSTKIDKDPIQNGKTDFVNGDSISILPKGTIHPREKIEKTANTTLLPVKSVSAKDYNTEYNIKRTAKSFSAITPDSTNSKTAANGVILLGKRDSVLRKTPSPDTFYIVW